jgi:uncharacterized membrane protein YagU involved in acid resistance
MIRKIANPRTRYQLVTILILIAGLGSAVVIYLTAVSPGESSMVDNFEESKRFVHDLELYGGKANVIANKFSRWFDGLWHGQVLAFTVAFLTVVIAAIYGIVAGPWSVDSTSDDEHGNNRSDIER